MGFAEKTNPRSNWFKKRNPEQEQSIAAKLQPIVVDKGEKKPPASLMDRITQFFK